MEGRVGIETGRLLPEALLLASKSGEEVGERDGESAGEATAEGEGEGSAMLDRVRVVERCARVVGEVCGDFKGTSEEESQRGSASVSARSLGRCSTAPPHCASPLALLVVAPLHADLLAAAAVVAVDVARRETRLLTRRSFVRLGQRRSARERERERKQQRQQQRR
jgi:hypothetical protein